MEGPHRLRPARFGTCDARRICLIKPSSLGDVVQTLPVLAALRVRFPRAHLAWVVNRSYAPLLRPIAELDEVIEFSRDQFRGVSLPAIAPFLGFLKSLRGRRFALAIDLQGLLRSGIMCWATGAELRVGLGSAREGSSAFYTDVIDDGGSASAVERYWKIAEAFGVGDLPKRFPLSLTDAERHWARDRLADLTRPILAVHAGARWPTKRWPAERFGETAARALGRGPGAVVLVGGDEPPEFAQRVAEHVVVPIQNLVAQLTLRQLAAVLELCDVLLTNDSGPMHLAAAVGTPTVSLFTCTAPERAAPFGDAHRIIQTSVGCKASYLKKCDRLDCMKDLTCEKVVPVLVDALRLAPPRTRCEPKGACLEQPDAA